MEFKSIHVIMRTHATPPIWHTHWGEEKKQVQLELNMYFDKLMCTNMDTYLEINADTMHQHVTGPVAPKTAMHMLSDELDWGAILVYPDATKASFRFQQDVTIEHTDTIMDDQDWC